MINHPAIGTSMYGSTGFAGEALEVAARREAARITDEETHPG